MDISPERLLAVFQKSPRRPIAFSEVMERIGAPSSHRLMVLHMLRAMARQGNLVRLRNKYFILPEPARIAKGLLQVSAKGTGFLLGGAKGGDDLYIHRSNLGTALDGDTVEAEIFTGARGGDEGRITRVLKRAHDTIVGEFTRRGKGGTVVPRNIKIGRWIEIPEAPPPARLPDGAWVLTRVRKWSDDPEAPLIADIEEILGKAGERGISILVMLRDMGIDPEFPGEVQRQTAHFHPPNAAKDLAHRLDLRREKIFTVDPATAKDFDDAISIHRLENGNWRLGVHIADVAQYVHPDTPLDKEALKRATSIYPVDRVVPMLPERLSGDVCSLRQREDRFALSVLMEITPAGDVERYETAESLIHSRHRLNYQEVQQFFDHADGRADKDADKRTGKHAEGRGERRSEGRGKFRFADIGEDLLAARELARILTARRMRRGALDLDLPEPEVECNAQGDTIALRRRERLESHRLIEEFMITANETVAEHLRKIKLPLLYRIHAVPNPAALEKIAPVLGLFGIKLPRRIIPSPEFYQPIVERLRAVDGGHIAQGMLLRTLMRAEYSPVNRGHFGLASKCYCHFTSPIRRYPDLVVHRVLKAWMRGETTGPAWAQALTAALPAVANQCNLMADRAMSVEHEAARVKSMELMKDHLGDIFQCWISGIVRSGFFVELVDMPVEGFVTAESIPGDTFAPDEDGVRLVGRHSRRSFPLGRRVNVRVVRVSEIDGQMDLELVEKSAVGKKAKRKGRKG